MTKYQCIHCGEPSNELYRDFNGGSIKITHCTCCGDVVDKYIEYEPVIIYLDALLLKIQAFRHILLNTVPTTIWKFTLVILLCEAFIKLLQDRFARFPKAGAIKPDYVFYSAFEWSLYWNYLVAGIEMAVFLTMVVLLHFVTSKIWRTQESKTNFKLVIQSLLWSNFGKVIVIPAMLWGQTYSAIYLSLSRAYIFAANVQALRVSLPKSSLMKSAAIVGVAYAVQWRLIACLPS